MGKSYYNIIEVLTGIYTVDDGVIKILLKKKKTNPYKGAWILPGNILSNEETFETAARTIAYDNAGIIANKMWQCHVFSQLNRDPDERIIAAVYSAVAAGPVRLNSDYELKWFRIDKLPRLGYDHEKIIKEIYDLLKKKIIHNDDNIIKEFFPDVFTLNEFQAFWEFVTDEVYDRRNFRKKLILQNYIKETNQQAKNKTGRPSKLYKFTDSLEEDSLI